MAEKYKLLVKNDSMQSGSICVYLKFPGQNNQDNLYSLAWYSQFCHPGTEVTFKWDLGYSFAWSATGELEPGVEFYASEIRPADPSNTALNSISISKRDGVFLFTPANQKGMVGGLNIHADRTIPNDQVAIGIGVGGKPAIVVNAMANSSYQFLPNPTYWVAFGDFEESRAIDLRMISETKEIKFPVNVFEKVVTFQQDHTWMD